MAPPYIWTTLASKQDKGEVDRWLDRSRTFRTPTSHPVRCQMCNINYDNHKMRYRLIECASSTCAACPGHKCEWRQKLLTCQTTHNTDIFQYVRHLTDISYTREPTLTREMKTFMEPLISMRMKPHRIYNNVPDHFGHTDCESPVLSQVHTFVGHYKRTALNETDFVDDTVKLVNKTQFTQDMQDGEAFTFGYDISVDGTPAIGEGTDDDPTMVGISTPYMMKMLRYAADYVFHIDTTYKLDQSGYPVLVVGVSDQYRAFHPVAMFVMAQQTGELIGTVLHRMFDMYKTITGGYPNLRYCMGDAYKAQYNAVIEIASTKHNEDGSVFLSHVFFLRSKERGRSSISVFDGGGVAGIQAPLSDALFP